jgi:adenine specific DNA methylase Mod
MEILKRSNRLYHTRPEGYPQIRVYHKKGFEKKMPRYLLKCGCCEEKLEIYYDEEGLEINGVNGSIDDWREILLPLLSVKTERMTERTHR